MAIENFKNIAVVLVTYNRVALLKRAIDALRNQTVKISNIIVVNNASTDGTTEYLDSEISIHHVRMTKNTGGAGGFHEGIKVAYSLNCNYIWVMDDDAIPNPNTLEHLTLNAENLNRDKIDWGFICSQVVSDNDENINVPTISKKRNKSGYLSWGEKGDEGLIGIDTATFVSVFMRREIPKDVGLPIKEMFIWGDDTEYTWRISKKRKCYLSLKSSIYHKRVSASALSIVNETNFERLGWYIFYYRNNLYSRRIHGNTKDLIIYFIMIFKDILNVCTKARGHKFKRVKCILLGLCKGISFKPKIIHVKDEPFDS